MYSDEKETTSQLKNSNFQESLIQEIFLVLNQKEQDIIAKRFAIQGNDKHTLEQIGHEYGITRERVRQIEKNALNKLARISLKTSFSKLIEITNKVIQDNSHCATEKNLIKMVIENTGGLFIDNKNLVALSFAINPELEIIKKSKTTRKSWYIAKKINKKQIAIIISITENHLKDNDQIIESNIIIDQIQTQLKAKKIILSKQTIISVLTISKKLKQVTEGYGLTTWRTVKPKSIRDKALIVLSRTKKPLHFRTISKLIHDSSFDKKNVTIQAVHNELIRYNDFVLVGRGIYALKEWGFQEGTVKDVITEILETSGPLNKNEIISEVLKRRHVKIGTISLNLQKYPQFKRIGRAVYSLES